MRILILGMAGGLSQIVANILIKKNKDFSILGVDSRHSKFPTIKSSRYQFKRMRYTRGSFEKLFRENSFDAVLHLGRLSHSGTGISESLEERLNINIMGTNRVLELCDNYNVKKVVVLSTYHVYGALPDTPTFIDEMEPLRASLRHPELRDVVEMDQVATNWMHKMKGKMNIIVLRPCSIIGKQINNAMTRYLTLPGAPMPIDFNPMFQFIHEYDMARVIIKSLLDVDRGVFNIAPDEVISIRKAKMKAGVRSRKVPIFLVEPMTKLLPRTFSASPRYLIEYLKYPCLLDNTSIREALPNLEFRYSIEDTLKMLRL